MTRKKHSTSWLQDLAVSTILLFLVASAACAPKPKEIAPACSVTPGLFCGPYQSLWHALPAEEREGIKASPSFGVIPHRGSVELEIRNTYGLWADNSLTRFFRSHGIKHPDIMSDVFLQGFIEYLQGKPANMDLLAKDAADALTPPAPPPPPSGTSE